MKVMILAAGRGERLRPLTDQVPKPMVRVAGKPLLEHLIERLKCAGYQDYVINLSYLGDQIEEYFGDGAPLGINIAYSLESEAALDTAGGVRNALPVLGVEPFAVINADVWTDYPFARLRQIVPREAHLVFVDNPSQHPDGDYVLTAGRVCRGEPPRLTFAGIGVYAPAFFAGDWPKQVALVPLIDAAINRQSVSGEHYRGEWEDLGTVPRLRALEQRLRAG